MYSASCNVQVLTMEGQTVGSLHTTTAVHDISMVTNNGKDFALMCCADTLAAVAV